MDGTRYGPRYLPRDGPRGCVKREINGYPIQVAIPAFGDQEDEGRRMKTLLIVSPETAPIAHDDAQRKRERDGDFPRASLLEQALGADVIDRASLSAISGMRRALYRPLPSWVIQTLEVWRQARHYDAVVTWDDRVALLYAGLRRLTPGRQPRHIAIVSWMPPSKKGLALSLAQRGIDRIIVWGGLQRDLLVELFGVAESRVVETCYFVDQQFFHPMDVPTDSMCAVGNSKRDYATLIQAMRGLPITCNIITTARLEPDGTSDWGVTGQALRRESEVPDNVVVRSATPFELRATYARAKFAVAPLFPNLRDHGITTIAEAMAMGKAVIASSIRGLPDFFEDGVTGLLVPAGDPAALRAAIEHLWAHPEVAARMGAEGRRRAETLFALDRFVASVRQVVDEVVEPNTPGVPTASPQQAERALPEHVAA